MGQDCLLIVWKFEDLRRSNYADNNNCHSVVYNATCLVSGDTLRKVYRINLVSALIIVKIGQLGKHFRPLIFSQFHCYEYYK